MKCYLIFIASAQVQLFENDVIMSGEQHLHASTLELQQNLYQCPKDFGIQIGLRLIP